MIYNSNLIMRQPARLFWLGGLLAVIALLSACSQPDSEVDSAEPAEVRTAEPAAEPSETEVSAAEPEPAETQLVISSPDDLEGETETLSYALGLFFGNQAKFFEGLDIDFVVTGFRDSYSEAKEPVFTEQEIGEIIIARQREIVEAQGEAAEAVAADFLAENAADERFTVLDNNLRYRVIREGDGEIPKAEDTVEVHYEGTLINGEVFDSSYQRDESAVFPVQGVIVGWQEILQLMPVGSQWEVVIPPDLAYGEQGSGAIGPNEVLIFQIELLGIQGQP